MDNENLALVLAKAILENPKLPVHWVSYAEPSEETALSVMELIAVVHTKVLSIESVLKYNLDETRIYFLDEDEDDMPDLLYQASIMSDSHLDDLPEDEQEAKIQQYVDSLKWEDCIRVNFE